MKKFIKHSSYFSILTRRLSYIILTLACISTLSDLRADTLTLTDEFEEYTLENKSFIFEDKKANKEINNVMAPEFAEKFKLNKEKAPNRGMSNSAFWIRFEVKNEATKNQKWLLEVTHSILDYVYIYHKNKAGEIVHSVSGDMVAFTDWKIKNHNIVHALEVPRGETRTFYLMVKATNSISIPMKIWSSEALARKDYHELFTQGLYFGIFLVMFLYNLLIYFTLRDLSYLYYVLFIFSIGVYSLAVNGLAFEYFWPSLPTLANKAPVFLVGFSTFWGSMFARSYLRTSHYSPKLSLVLLVSAIASGLACAFTLVMPAGRLSATLVTVIGMLSAAFIIGSGVYILFKKNYPPAKHYTMAWMLFLVGSLINGLRAGGVVQENAVTSNIMQFGSAMLVILLARGLAYRINLFKQEKEEAQLEALNNHRMAIENLKKAERQKDDFLSRLRTLNAAYNRFVPEEFLKFLGKESIVDVGLGDQTQKHMTIVFIDIRSFTSLSESMTPKENFDFINSYLRRIGPIIRKYHGIIDKYIGDAIMALFDSPEHAMDAAIEIQTTVRQYNVYRVERNYMPIRVGIGMHSGSLMLGTIGESERMDGTVISDAVNLASRMENVTKLYDATIVISGTTLYEIQDPSHYNYRPLGVVKVKGKKDPITIFEILDGDEPEIRSLKLKTRESFEQAIHHFLTKNFTKSKEYFGGVLAVNPKDRPARYFQEKSLYYEKTGTPVNWKGI